MTRRAVLLVGLAVPAAPAGALTPCTPGTRPGTLAQIRFGLVLPNGDEVTKAQWRRFRGDALDPMLRTAITERDEAPLTAPRPQRTRLVFAEVPSASWVPGTTPALPPTVRGVMRAWTDRFPDAPVEARLLPACLAP